jgi:hypothetical protein
MPRANAKMPHRLLSLTDLHDKHLEDIVVGELNGQIGRKLQFVWKIGG